MHPSPPKFESIVRTVLLIKTPNGSSPPDLFFNLILYIVIFQGVSPGQPDVLAMPPTRYRLTVRGKPARTGGRHRWIRRFTYDQIPRSSTGGCPRTDVR
jgi:hypothetical protein